MGIYLFVGLIYCFIYQQENDIELDFRTIGSAAGTICGMAIIIMFWWIVFILSHVKIKI